MLTLFINHPVLQAGLVRVSRCSHLFIQTVLLQHEDFVDAVGAPALHYAAACIVEGEQLVEDTGSCGVQKRYPAWFLRQRPASVMQRLTIDWEVPLAKVKHLVEQHLQRGGIQEQYGDTYIWQGRRLKLSLQASREVAAGVESSTEAALDIGCYLQLKPRNREMCNATFKLWLLKAGSSTAEDAVEEDTITAYFRGKSSWGSAGFVYMDPASSWQQVERALREKQAVHADGCLHIRAVVKKLE
jgi:hypothetical protein